MIVAGYANRDRIRLKLSSVYASVPPKASDAVLAQRRREAAVGIAAPWVLSALPECWRQTFEASGTRAYVASKLPAAYAAAPPGTVLQSADCTLRVRASDVLVERGADRFYVPARARLYQKGSNIALMRETGNRAILRIYRPAP